MPKKGFKPIGTSIKESNLLVLNQRLKMIGVETLSELASRIIKGEVHIKGTGTDTNKLLVQILNEIRSLRNDLMHETRCGRRDFRFNLPVKRGRVLRARLTCSFRYFAVCLR